MKHSRFTPVAIATALLLCGIYFWGLANIAALPPFEGFDEPGHYSYIEQLAWTGTRPHQGDPMSAEVDTYLTKAPTAESMQGAWTYASFFAARPETVASGSAAAKAPTTQADAWTPGSIANWEAQHPPLYYALLTPFARATAGLSLSARLLVMRIASYTMACTGLLLGCLAAIRLASRMCGMDAVAVRLAPVFWPLLLPMWFVDVARLGNDAMVMLVAGAVALVICEEPEMSGSRRSAVLLGSLLGFGLLTKATFLPLAVATIFLLTWRILRAPERDQRWKLTVHFGLCCMALAVVSGWWYVEQVLETGSFIGSNDAVHVSAQGGLLSMLKEHGSLAAFLRIPYTYAVSIIWAGSWSAVIPPLSLVAPLFVGALLIAAAAVRKLVSRPMRFIEKISCLTLALFLSGLTFQSVYLIAVNGNPAPAWYLHSFMPVLSFLLAIGISEIAKHGVIFSIYIFYLPFFLISSEIVQVTTFAGCGSTLPKHHQLTWSSVTSCMKQTSLIMTNLNQLTFPYAGIAMALVAILLMIIGLIYAVVCLQKSRALVLSR